MDKIFLIKKNALKKLSRAKNNKIVINDTDKNIGAADADKKDMVFECARQLSDIKNIMIFKTFGRRFEINHLRHTK